LALQRDGRRRHDDRRVVGHRTRNRRNQVGQRLAGPGAGLHREMLAGLEGVRDGLGHLQLAATLTAAEGRHRGGQ
jgi:hypothetical protein